MDNNLFFDSIKQSLFQGNLSQNQVAGINALLTEWTSYPDNIDIRYFAYILATVFHETAKKMQPVTEYGGDAYLRAKPYYPYYGRDLVQTTWKMNYQRVKDFSGIDVVSNPELIGQMPLAATVAITFMDKGWYTSKKLSDYFNGATDDPLNARRIINGTNDALLIESYHNKFLSALNS